MTGASILLALRLAEPVVSPIRSHHARIVRAIDEASLKSVTFQALVDRLIRSDLIIYVESGHCRDPQVRSCVAVVSTSGSDTSPPYRYLRVTIDTDHSHQIIVAEIAHELQHAVEIAEAPEVVDGTTLGALYDRIGTQGARTDVHETANAIAVARRVSKELVAQAGSHNPRVAKEQKRRTAR